MVWVATTPITVNSSPTDHRSADRLTKLYLVALSAIAVLALLGYAVERFTRPRASDAQVIVMAARQRMLGQQISKSAIAAASAATDEDRTRYLDELGTAATELGRAHRALRDSDPVQGIAPEDDPVILQRLDQLEPRLTRLQQEARDLDAQLRPVHANGSSELTALTGRLIAEEAALMADANSLVLQVATVANDHVQSSDQVQFALTAGLLLAIAPTGAPFVRLHSRAG